MSLFDWLEPHAAMTSVEAGKLFFLLAAGHALADFPLQGEFLAKVKNPNFPQTEYGPSIWPLAMTAHCLIHSLAVILVTGSFLFGLIELVVHFALDILKCAGRVGFWADQIAHYSCKAGYALLWLYA